MAKNVNYLGIDLGGSSLKIVELKNAGNRAQLVTYGYIDHIPNIIKEENKEAQKEVANFLKHLLKESNATASRAVSALPSFSVFSSIISLPAMNNKDLISAVRWEAKKFVPIPLEEMILDWEILKESGKKDEKKGKFEIGEVAEKSGEKEKKEKDESEDKKKKKEEKAQVKGNIKVLLTAAPKNLVNRYVELFKNVGIQLVGLETESFAIERSLVGNDKNPIMVVDIGGRATSIIIYYNGVPILNRSIDVGGKTVTKSLVEVMGLSEERAEQFKRDMGISVSEELLEKLPQPINYVVSSIINEIRYILNIYQSQKKKPVMKVVLTGGSSFLMNLANYVQNVFNIKSYVGDPWARVVHPVEIDSLLKQLGPRLSVAIGLAMREIV